MCGHSARPSGYVRRVARLARWLLPWSSRWISRDSAIVLAKAAVVERGLPWVDPIRAVRHYGDWQVVTASNVRGGNVRVTIDAGSGLVKWIGGPTPR
jgi:hypothetical protein